MFDVEVCVECKDMVSEEVTRNGNIQSTWEKASPGGVPRGTTVDDRNDKI